MITETEQKHVKDVYENIAEGFNHTRAYKWKWIDDFYKTLNKNTLVYDVGCGSGRNMDYDGLNFIGIDNCSNFIKICKSKNLNVINANVTDIPLESNSADAIICIAMFHQLSSYENRIKCLLEIKRLIKSEGKILLSVWSIKQPAKTKKSFNKYGNNIVTWDNYGKIYERYYYIFKIDEIKDLFKKTNLELLDHYYDCGNEIFVLTKL
tara:strand:+ start:23501 stop:24124 length:624 start_codon:yes stop_codon:yes gene_type:complete